MEELTGLDARFLYSETPTAHMHTMKVAIVDVGARSERLTPELFGALLGERLDRMPALRRRVVLVPHRLSHPVWVEDPEFDLTRHVNWRMTPTPGGRRELAAIVADVAARQLPRDRPLWELTVVDGLADGRIAFIVKIHHALADGVAAAAMLENAFRSDQSAPIVEPAHPEPIPGADELMRRAMANRRRRVVRLPALVRENLRGTLAARRTERSANQHVPRLFTAPRTTFNVSLVPERNFAVTDLNMEDILAVKRAHGVQVNDVFLAVCGGAIRAYLSRRGKLPAVGLNAGVPIATHRDEVRLSGNHVDNIVLPLRTDLADPVQRLLAIHETAQAARGIREALGTDLFERRSSHTPPHLYPWSLRLWAATRLANLVRPPLSLIASNVAGPTERLDLHGGSVEELWSVGPILEGIGLNVTAWSYTGSMFVSVLGCPKSLPDPDELVADIEASLTELVAAVPAS